MNPKQKAQTGVQLLKEATLELLKEHPDGLRHADIVRLLDIPSDYQGRQKNYLSYSVIGLLLNVGAIERVGNLYVLARSSAAGLG